MPERPNPEKVATPVLELMTAVVVPTNRPPRFTRTETVPPTPVTTALEASSTVTEGCVENAAPEAAPAADVVTTNFVADAANACGSGLTTPSSKANPERTERSPLVKVVRVVLIVAVQISGSVSPFLNFESDISSY